MGRKQKNLNLTIFPQSLDQLQNLEQRKFFQANQLIESIFEQSFKELELKVLCLISKYINESKFLKVNTDLRKTIGSFLEININKKEFCNFLHINPSNFYQQIKILAQNLIKKSIFIESMDYDKKKKKFISMTLFSSISFLNGKAIFHINPALQIYLQHLKSNFTAMSLEYISNMNSAHAIKIYQLLKQYEQIGKRNFTIINLKKTLGIEKLYKNSFTDFKKNVLEIAKKEINTSSNIETSFTTKKQGKKVEEIEFKIVTKKNHFQQAVKAFITQMDIYFERGAAFFLDNEHKKLHNYWLETQKNIEKNKLLFEEWIKNTTKCYAASSITKLSIKPISEFSNPIWYLNFLKLHYS